MSFDFLFQSNEGVYNLIKRKTKVLTFTSLAGFLTTVILTVVFLFDIDRIKFIPGIIALGSVFALIIIFLMKGIYKASIRVIFLLPLVLYFFYIDNYYSIVDVDDSLSGMLTFFYFSLIFLVVFGDSILLILFFFIEFLLTLLYFLYQNNLFEIGSIFDLKGVFFSYHPFFEMAVMVGLACLLFVYYDSLITKTDREHRRTTSLIDESMRQFNGGVIQMRIIRDEQGEKAGMRIMSINSYFEKIFRISKNEAVDADFSDIFPLIFRNTFNWQHVYYHSRKNSFQVYIEHIDKWFNVYNVFPETDMIISSFIDVSDLKIDLIRHQSREARLTKLLGSLPDIFFIIESDGTYVDYVTTNPDLMMLGQKDIIGRTIFEMGFSKAMTYQIFSSIQFVIENDSIETIEYGMELPGGKTLIFEMRIARLSDTQVISIGRDITTNKEYQLQLIDAKKKTEEASRLKSSFLENISHEIRTPMNAILGFSNMAMTTNYSAIEQRRFLEIVIKNGEYLMGVITNIIDISEIESRAIEFCPSPFRINDLFLTIYNKYQNKSILSNQGVQLKLSLGSDLPDFIVESDNDLLLKIITQLVENALKFTNNGSVVFGYETLGDLIKIFVRDTGIGIDKKDHDTIFEHFRQIDNRLSRSYSGTGAGLKIVKSLTGIIGSKIELESQPGKGSEFYFSIPVRNC
jgi:signal transduction histidine kinase